MRILVGWAVLLVTLGVLQCSPAEEEPTGISEDTLKQLSLRGGRLVDEEVRKALYGVKQMKEVMKKNQEKHRHLMESLRHSRDKRKEGLQLTEEVTNRLLEAEQQCQTSLRPEWEACRPCLEQACKSFYTSTCRRGFSSFHTKVENFFHRVSARFGSQREEAVAATVSPAGDPEDVPDVEVVRIEDSFNQLLGQVGSLYSRSVVLVSHIHDQVDAALQKAFSPQAPEKPEPTADPFFPARDSAFLQGVGLEDVLDSFYDFGRSVVEKFGAVVTQVFDDQNEAEEEEMKRERDLFPRFLQTRKLCRDLRRQTAECWQLQNQCEVCQGPLLTECPSVRTLHMQLAQASQLLEVSRDQYQQILDIAQRHADDTISWLSNMAAEFSWVAALADANLTPQTLFNITTVAQGSAGGTGSGAAESQVDVSILNSPRLVLSVPAGLEVTDPAFIQYVTQEALDSFRQTVRDQE